MQLFNRKTIARHIERAEPADQAKLSILRDWAATIDDESIKTQSEVEIEDLFKQRIVCEVLGYRPFNQDGEWTVASKAGIGAGAVDLALGHFTPSTRKIIAPFELKGAKTKDLDAIMPGRAKSPVDQAWEYASNNVGTKWVLVSNYLEIRLYSYADGRQFFESFNLANLHQPDEYQRFTLLLSADSLLSGKAAQLLAESRIEDKDITDALYADYKVLRSSLIGAVETAKPDMDPLERISVGQTILDRVLFIAFAEDNGLLPDNSLLQAFEARNEYNPQPVWQNFLGLFTAIDQGSTSSKSRATMAAFSSVTRSSANSKSAMTFAKGSSAWARMTLPAKFLSRCWATYSNNPLPMWSNCRPRRAVRSAEKKASGTSGRRKRDGVVYTPDYVARFIVEQTLGTHCREIFDGILAQYAAKGARADDDPIKWKSAKAEKQAWQAYRDRLTTLRIVDPACGSGVFLVIAFDWMKTELERVNGRLAALDGGYAGDLFDPDSEILTNNLFGVDVNSESVEIAKLSLWIKTARRGKVLDSLDGNLRVGDSLIEDSSYAYREEGFVWKEAFSEVFAEGGFDVVLGNPPYVRMELIKPMKPWLEKRYEVVSDRADLYAYFFERGIKLLKPGGRLGYISSSTFFKTGSGKPLREFLRSKATLETVVDFGDHQIFEGVTTYPAILTMKAGAPPKGHELLFWNIEDLPDGNFLDGYESKREPYPQDVLPAGSWQLEPPELRALREKIVGGRRTLKGVYGSPCAGIKTGYNKAFVLSDKEKAELCKDATSAPLLKQIVFGSEVRPWRLEHDYKWLIYIPKNKHNIQKYPAVLQWLTPHRGRLEKRAAKQEWFELQQAQDRFADAYEGQKLVYRDIADRPTFSVDTGSYIDMTCFCLPDAGYLESALLNSSTLWFSLISQTTIASGGFYRMKSQYIEQLPIPEATPEQKAALGALAEAAQTAAEKRYKLQQSVARRIPDLAADPATAKLSNKLKEWWALPDFAAFQKEVKKTLKAEILLKERSEWEDWIKETKAEIDSLTAEIARLEGEINAQVYALFDLTPAEIELLEANI